MKKELPKQAEFFFAVFFDKNSSCLYQSSFIPCKKVTALYDV
ncbi:hypothetical protein BAXH7_04118 [Bacillus amyloliquefaciens XH7]|nr:hypothetical protein BAXH7_04118 [Bacillus amyloliquefaciens XH7]